MGLARELGGFVLLLFVAATPLMALVALLSLLDGDVPVWFLALSALAVALWPASLLNAYRLLRADPVRMAEADGRRPVLLLHAFTASRTPRYERWLPTPALLADFRDVAYERAIARGFAPVGPLVPFARPKPPPDHGPVRSMRDTDWEHALERAIREAQLVVIVLDGSEANAHEVERALSLRAPRRVVLLAPPVIDAAFLRAYEALAARLARAGVMAAGATLPPFSATTVGVRFDREGRPTAQEAIYGSRSWRQRVLRDPSLMLFAGEEREGGARRPISSWLLSALPLPLWFFGAVVTPFLLEAQGVRVSGGQVGGWTGITLLLAIGMAVMSVRVTSPVPRGEALMVGLAALPWLASLSTNDASELSDTAVAAAYSAPLLFAAAVVLALAGLLRKAPGRQLGYALFGFAAMIPFATLAASLGSAMRSPVPLSFTVLGGAAVLGLVSISASGDASHRDAPSPLGAASAAALAIAAWSYTVAAEAWRRLLSGVGGGYFPDDEVRVLDVFSTAWPWFALVLPFAAVLMSLPFKGRANRSALAGVASLLPLVLIFGLATRVQARARERIETHRAIGTAALFEPIRAVAIRDDFAPPSLPSALESPGEIDWIVDEGGVLSGGARVATASDVLAAPGWGGAGLSREVARFRREGGRALRVTTDARTPANVLAAAMGAALAQNVPEVELVGQEYPGGPPVGMRIGPARSVGAPWVLSVGTEDVTVRRQSTFPDRGGRIDDASLRRQLEWLRQMSPERTAVSVRPESGVSIDRLLAAFQIVQQAGLQPTVAP